MHDINVKLKLKTTSIYIYIYIYIDIDIYVQKTKASFEKAIADKSINSAVPLCFPQEHKARVVEQLMQHWETYLAESLSADEQKTLALSKDLISTILQDCARKFIKIKEIRVYNET